MKHVNGTPRPVPIARPFAPTPAKPEKHSTFGGIIKGLAVIIFAVVCSLIGGLVLPHGAPAPVPPPEPVKSIAVAAPIPAAEDPVALMPPPAPVSVAESVSPEPPEPATPPPVVKAVPAGLTRPREEPAVLPQLPPGAAGALALAVDKELDRTLAEAKLPASPLTSDAEFLRRAYLDLVGHIPTHDQAVAFLDNPDPLKRSKLIDELLASPDYGRHFANFWTDLLVKRDFDNNKNLKTDAFVTWLAEKLNKNEKWDAIVTALLTAEGKEEQSPATFFVQANLDNNQPAPDKLVDATGNLFMGIQIQCAQCHVHPFNKKWTPDDFWGMAAFFGHTHIEYEAGMKGKPVPGTGLVHEVERHEEPRGKAAVKAGDKAIAPGSMIAIPDPTNPKKTLRTVPAKFFEVGKAPLGNRVPYRPALAAWVASENDPYFAPALVNRLWGHCFGRGFVNPVDDMKDDNPASHPKLLKRLADEFMKNGYDLKLLLRVLCNTQAYQRTSRPLPENAADEKLFSHMTLKVLDAQVLLDSLATAMGHEPKGAEPRAVRMKGMGKKGEAPPTLVRFFDTTEYGDDTADYEYGVPQALKLMNSSLSNRCAEVAEQLAKSGGSREKVIEEIYLTALARRPSVAETQRMAEYVAKQGTPSKGYAGVFWALLNCAEFTCNR